MVIEANQFVPFTVFQLFNVEDNDENKKKATLITNIAFKNLDRIILDEAQSFAKKQYRLLTSTIETWQLDELLTSLKPKGISKEDLSTVCQCYGYAYNKVATKAGSYVLTPATPFGL